MRGLATTLAILLLTVLLLYGGLNLVELGMTGLLARECKHEVLAIGMDPQGALLVTFAGRSARLHAGELCAALKQRWDNLLDHAETILQGKILDKTPDG